MFVRFLAAVSKCPPALEYAVPTIAEWRLSTLPKYLEPQDLEKVIGACAPVTPLGARDQAMILLMARLGLRAGDVAALKLCDIDWQNATLVVSGKNRRETRFASSQRCREFGEALSYEAPPKGSQRQALHIYSRSCCPDFPADVSDTLDGRFKEPESRRHRTAPICSDIQPQPQCFVKGLLSSASQRSYDTLGSRLQPIYAKVDVDLLKEVVLPWPEVETC